MGETPKMCRGCVGIQDGHFVSELCDWCREAFVKTGERKYFRSRPSVEKKPGCFENALSEPGALTCLSCDVRDECRKKKWAEVEKPQREYREWKGIP